MFGSINPFLETFLSGLIGYVAIVIILQLSGKRTLAKWNSFDFIVTLALGSILASILLSNKDEFGRAIMGFALLVALRYIITWISVRSPIIQKLIKAKPTLLLYKGQIQQETMTQERIAEGELLAALRASNVSAVEDVAAVVLETDGSFSVIKDLDRSSASALKDVQGFDRTSMINS